MTIPATLESDAPMLTPVLSSHDGARGGVARRLLKGSSALGLAVGVERGLGFVANILAARLGGASTFGAYSLAISTANNISTYAGGGIGATAARFSGKYPFGGRGYPTLVRVLAIVSLVSAFLAALALWFGAAPIAHIMQKPSLTGLLRWTAISAVGIILLECARGLFVGQSRLSALVTLSLIVGVSMVCLIPAVARMHNPVRLIVLQGLITTTAVVVCVLLARPLGLLSPRTAEAALPVLPMLKEVWAFGLIQLSGLIGVNFAGWWLVTLVARSDTSLVQMSFFSIASQLRNLAALVPSLLTESSYAVMGNPDGEASQTPQYVMGLCTYGATFGAYLIAAIGIIVAPLVLGLIYGHAYGPAGTTVVVALCVAVAHMGNAPAAARLSIVSIRATGVINTLWALFVAAAATALMVHGGSAWKAMVIYLAAHLFSALLVLGTLARKDSIPEGMLSVFGLGVGSAMLLTLLAGLRMEHRSWAFALTAVMLLLAAGSMWALLSLGRRHGWMPGIAAIVRHLETLRQLHRRLFQGGRNAA